MGFFTINLTARTCATPAGNVCPGGKVMSTPTALIDGNRLSEAPDASLPSVALSKVKTWESKFKSKETLFTSPGVGDVSDTGTSAPAPRQAVVAETLIVRVVCAGAALVEACSEVRPKPSPSARTPIARIINEVFDLAK